MAISNKIKGFKGQNPFSDSQPRNFSDKKVYNEFYPISTYWTLFNDQHEVLLGTRGSGKTFLLKMMRYSMLKHIDDDRAKKIAQEKKYLAIYVPMHLEFVVPFNNSSNFDKRVKFFQIAFNCCLAEALLVELKSIIDDIPDMMDRISKQYKLLSRINQMWFEKEEDIGNIDLLSDKVKKIYYSMKEECFDKIVVPNVFCRQICSPLIAIKDIIYQTLEFSEEPTWLVCVDEAEFLNKELQKCINSVFRSDSNRITLKVATLPFYHTTLETLEPGITVSDGNDFCYRNVDMQYSDMDFIGLTNKLCFHRLKERYDDNCVCETVEEFVGVVGNDDLIDYYRKEVGSENSTQEIIQKRIIAEFPNKRRENAPSYSNRRKTIYDKYAPIFFVREMYKLSNKGNRKPGWYAGAKMIRKVAQGNPRMFIQIMAQLFDCARTTTLTPKSQHGILTKYAKHICESTKALELEGPTAYKCLKIVSEALKNRIHGSYIVTGGLSFSLKFNSDEEFEENLKWIQLAIAYSRVAVDEDVMKYGLTKETKYVLSHAYAVAYWLPMRNDSTLNITLTGDLKNSYKVKANKEKHDENYQQLSFWEEK